MNYYSKSSLPGTILRHPVAPLRIIWIIYLDKKIPILLAYLDKYTKMYF